MVRRLRVLLRDRLARGLVLEHPLWSWLMVIGALLRASSYWFRPPESVSPASARIEGVLSYPVWTVILITYALLIAVGTRWPRRHTPEAWLGHAAGVATSAALASSILASAVLDGGAWSAFWPLVVVMLIHAARANALGPATRRAIESGIRWVPGRKRDR
jgi:hypothetical protein